jgi:hypothetical protein
MASSSILGSNQYTRGKVFCSRCSRWYDRSEFGDNPMPVCPECHYGLRVRPRGRRAKMRYYQHTIYNSYYDCDVPLP